MRKNPAILGIVNSFGGGLFLAGGVIHILPEALHKMEAWYKGGHDDHRLRMLSGEAEESEDENFPWPAFGAVLIFVAQMAVEKTAGRQTNAGWLFAIGMSLHAVFAGLALGLETKGGSFVGLTLAIVAHKFSECIAVGVKIYDGMHPVGSGEARAIYENPGITGSARAIEMNGNNTQIKPENGGDTHAPVEQKSGCQTVEISMGNKVASWIFLALFIITLPLGIGIGWGVHDIDKWTEGFLLGMSAGTFIYTGTIHVIPEEFGNGKHLWWKTLMYVLGFGVICAVWFIEHKAFDGHGH